MRGNGLGNLGIGNTSVLLISRWMSANAMFTVSAATVKYGIIAGLLFALMGVLAFFVFGLIGKKARYQEENTHSIVDLLQGKIENRTKKILFILIGIGYGLDFILLAIGASIIFYATVLLPPILGVLLFITFGIPLFFFKTYKDYGKYIIYKIGIFQSVIIIIVVFLFLSSNLEDMYFRMKLFNPYIFSIQKEELTLFTVSVFIIFLSKLVTDLGTWNILFRVKAGKIRQGFLLTGLIWSTIPLTFSIIMFPVLFQGGFINIYTIYYDLLNLFESDFLLLLTAGTILITLITTYYSRLHEFLRLFENTKFNKKTKSAPLVTILCIALLYGIYYLFQPSLLELFFFTGILNSSLLIPFLFIIFSKKKNHDRITLLAILTSVLVGYISNLFLQQHVSVLIPILTSFLILGAYYKFNQAT